MNLKSKHLEDFRKSTITDETLSKYDVSSISREEAERILGCDVKSGGWLIRYPITGYPRLKLDKKYGKFKYCSPKDTATELMRTHLAIENHNDISVPFYFVEGEKKAMALEQLRYAAISTPGVWNWKSQKHDLEILGQLNLANRSCYICFDSDKYSKDNVRLAEKRLAETLKSIGAMVGVVNLLPGLGKGVDDQIARFTEDGNLNDLKKQYLENPVSYESYMKDFKEVAKESTPDVKDLIISLRYKKVKPFQSRKEISQVIIEDLKRQGKFVYTALEPFYFYDATKTLIRFTDKKLMAIINENYGINASEPEWNFLLKEMETEVIMRGTKTAVRQFAAFDNGKLYISKFDGQMYVLDGEKVQLADNGFDGVLFLDNPSWRPYEYLDEDIYQYVDGGLDLFSGFVDDILVTPINFMQGGSVFLGPEEQKLLFRIYIDSLFLEERQPTKPILVFVGEKGSGKTSAQLAILLWLLGKEARLKSVAEKREDFDATIGNNYIAFFDNADTKRKWLNDSLATYSTGGSISKRELYTTNTEREIVPRAFIGLNARTPRFRRDDVVDRLLLFNVARLEKFKGEGEIRDTISQYRDLLWTEQINHLNSIIRHLKIREGLATTHRMADFAVLGHKIAKAMDREEMFLAILEKMQKRQSEFLLEDDLFFDTLQEWLENGNFNRSVSAKELNKELSEIAKENKDKWEYSSVGIGSKLHNVLSNLRSVYDVDTNRRRANVMEYCFKVKGG